MKLKKETIDLWENKFNESFPGLLDAIAVQNEKVFLIGASLLDIYVNENWMNRFSRKTGDADLAMEYSGSPDSYLQVCKKLESLGYKKDEIHPYRYHPPKIKGIYSYLDLLVFTTDPLLEDRAKVVMSVGENFNFQGMDFAKNVPLLFKENIFFPNPMALIYLKMKSYFHNPERTKDFVDFIEIILRLIMADGMLDMLKASISYDDFIKVKSDFIKMCQHIEQDKGKPWDLEDIRDELSERLLLEEFEFDEIPNFVAHFRQQLFG